MTLICQKCIKRGLEVEYLDNKTIYYCTKCDYKKTNIKMETATQDQKIGKIKPFMIYDPVKKINLEIKVSDYYTIIIIDKREYYFNSDTGEFDGTGQECNPPIKD